MAIFSEISQITFIFFFILSFSFIHSKNSDSIDKTSLTVVVLSQHYESRYISNEILNQWRLQSEREQRLNYFNVLISSDISSDLETLSIVLLLNKLSKTQRDASDWFLMLNPHTRLELHPLLDILLQFPDPRKVSYFLAHGLSDVSHTIIHHFSPPHSLHYPMDCSGFALSQSVLKRISDNWSGYSTSFTIDPFYEMSSFLKYMRVLAPSELHPYPPAPHKDGVLLTHVSKFCINHSNQCATSCNIKSCTDMTNPLTKQDLFFAIKTCQDYHLTRIPIQLKTWTAPTHDLKLRYYSDVDDPRYGATNVGIPNTKTGHCTKTLKILELALSHDKDFKWLILADDDTLMSVSRLMDFLACHNEGEPLVIGEIYGYNLGRPGGYLFPTAGSGVAFSRLAVDKIVRSRIKCPALDTPDDMFLGQLIRRLKINLLHSSLFHQDQPSSYHDALINSIKSISFHRFKPQDPIEIYNKYLSANSNDNNFHTKFEL